MSPIISLSIKEFDPLGAAATLSGIGYSCMGIVAAVSSFVAGRLSQRFPLKQILVFCCIGTSFLYLPPIWAATVIQFLGFIALMGLLKGGIITSTNALIGLTAPENAKGIAYGLSQSASSLGSGIGPLVGGSLATVMGLRPVFAVAGGVYLIVGIAISTLLVGVSLAKKEAGSN
jgi:DHA1 family multidrug resistance protein-like MFS transporter